MFIVCTVFESFHVLGEFIRPSRLFDTRVNTVAVFIGSLNVIVIFVDDGTLIAPFAGVAITSNAIAGAMTESGLVIRASVREKMELSRALC